MMKVLVDAELFLEFFLNRNQYEKDTCRLLKMAESGQIELYITELCVDKIRLEDKRRGIPDEEGISRYVEKEFKDRIIKFNYYLWREQIFESIGNRVSECALEVDIAIANNIRTVVTHKTEDFCSADLLVWTVNDLLNGLNNLPVLTETDLIDFLKFKLELSYKQDGLAGETERIMSPPARNPSVVTPGQGFGATRKKKTYYDLTFRGA